MLRRALPAVAAALVAAGTQGAADQPWAIEDLGRAVGDITCGEAMAALDPDSGEESLRLLLRAMLVGAAASQTVDHDHPTEFGIVLRYTEAMVFLGCTVNRDRLFRTALRKAAPKR